MRDARTGSAAESWGSTVVAAGVVLVGLSVLFGIGLLVTRHVTDAPTAQTASIQQASVPEHPPVANLQQQHSDESERTPGVGRQQQVPLAGVPIGQAGIASAPLSVTGSPSTDSSAADAAADANVSWPDAVTLDGQDIPPGSGGVTSDGARAVARTLSQRLLAVYGSRLSDAAELDALAEQTLAEQLVHGYPATSVVRQGADGVLFEMLGVLPQPPQFRLAPPPPQVQRVGVAVGVAQRTEPGYLPDLVAVAAVAYGR